MKSKWKLLDTVMKCYLKILRVLSRFSCRKKITQHTEGMKSISSYMGRNVNWMWFSNCDILWYFKKYCDLNYNIFKGDLNYLSYYFIDIWINFYAEKLWWIRYTWSWTCQLQYRLQIHTFFCGLLEYNNNIFVLNDYWNMSAILYYII